MIQRLMLYGIPFSLLISGAAFPLGVVIYWTTNNLFSLGQQFWVLHKYPPPPNVGRTGTGTAKSGGPAKPGVKAGAGKGAPAKPEPSAAAKALAPKVGAKPVKKTASPGLQARRAAAAKKASAAQKTSDATPTDTPSASPNGSGVLDGSKGAAGSDGAAKVNGAAADTPTPTAGRKATGAKKGNAARRLSG
jgi:hypothetical protein